MPKISVIVPAYNMELYVGKCMNSLINQTQEDIEIIMVNDGSTDRTKDVIEKKISQHSEKNIKLYNKENGGQSDARNYGLKKANGDYIVYVDSDDWLEENALELLYNSAKKDDSDIVICDIEEVYENGYTSIRKEINSKADNIQKAFMIAMPGFCNKMFRKKFLLDIDFKFPNGIFYEDLAVYPKVAAKAEKISYIEQPLYKYRIRSGSTMKQTKNSKRLKDIFKAFEYIEEDNEKMDNFKEEIEYIYIVHLLHSASLRFLNYKSEEKNIIKIADIIKQKFPKWRKNKYLKNENIKYKIVCNLIYMKQITLLRLLLRVKTYDT